MCKSCATCVGTLHYGRSPQRPCPPRKLFTTIATCQKIARHQEDGLEVVLAFVREGFRGRTLFQNPVFGHNRRHPMCPLWSLPLSRFAPQIAHVTLGILCLQRSTRSPAVTESARSFPLVIIAQATGGNQVRDGSFAPSLRRHGGQPTSRRKCQDRSCSPALCRSSRHLWSRSLAGTALAKVFQRDRCIPSSARDPPAGSVFFLLVRHLFGASRSRLVWIPECTGQRSPPSWPSPFVVSSKD